MDSILDPFLTPLPTHFFAQRVLSFLLDSLPLSSQTGPPITAMNSAASTDAGQRVGAVADALAKLCCAAGPQLASPSALGHVVGRVEVHCCLSNLPWWSVCVLNYSHLFAWKVFSHGHWPPRRLPPSGRPLGVCPPCPGRHGHGRRWCQLAV